MLCNFKFLVVYCIFCATFAFAQLRGFAYNPYGTLGAAPTVADIVEIPSDIYGNKFAYVSPYLGYSAFDLAGGSMLLGFDNSLIVGFAKNFYGLSLRFAPSKTCWGYYDDFECRSDSRDYIGLNFSVPFGNTTIYAGSSLNKYEDSDEKTTQKYFSKDFSIGITGGEKLVWDAAFGFTNYNNTSYSFYKNDITLMETNVLYNLGYMALQNDKTKLIIGLNNTFFYQFLRTKNRFLFESETYRHHTLMLDIYPSIFTEIILTKRLLVFTGAKHNINLLNNLDYENKFMSLSISNSGSNAYLGLRYEYNNFAVETRLQNEIFETLYSGHSPLVSLGVFVTFP